MKYWIVVNRQQCGPFELAELETMNFDMQTPAWHDGLPDWVPAGDIAELRELIERRSQTTGNGCQPISDSQAETTVDVNVETVSDENVVVTEEYSGQAAPRSLTGEGVTTDEYGMKRFDESKRPASYLGWAIASTILCCLPLGVLAIIFSASVNSKFERGDEEGALKASERAQWCIMLSITLGLALSPFQSMLSML